jgi:hypothetical protein
MKKQTNLTSSVLVLAVVLIVGLGCGRFTGSTTAPNTSKPGNYIQEDKPTGTAPEPKKVEAADFTLTAEEYDKAFTRKGVKESDLEKYKSKNIRVTGRISLMSLTKEGTVQPYVKLYAPGTLNGVSCSFDDEDLAQMKPLKMDKVITVQGFQGSFVVPEVSPMLDHCVVIKAD